VVLDGTGTTEKRRNGKTEKGEYSNWKKEESSGGRNPKTHASVQYRYFEKLGSFREAASLLGGGEVDKWYAPSDFLSHVGTIMP